MKKITTRQELLQFLKDNNYFSDLSTINEENVHFFLDYISKNKNTLVQSRALGKNLLSLSLFNALAFEYSKKQVKENEKEK